MRTFKGKNYNTEKAATVYQINGQFSVFVGQYFENWDFYFYREIGNMCPT